MFFIYFKKMDLLYNMDQRIRMTRVKCYVLGSNGEAGAVLVEVDEVSLKKIMFKEQRCSGGQWLFGLKTWIFYNMSNNLMTRVKSYLVPMARLVQSWLKLMK
jgi:hypothetical protein